MNTKNVEAIYPLSPAQQGMLFHTLCAPRSGVYLNQIICVIDEPLNVAAFKEAWQSVVDRHVALRTFIWQRSDQPLQVVMKATKLIWDEQDWSGISTDEVRQRLESYLRDDRERGIDLSKAPLMRMALLKVAQDQYQFIWSLHHLILDGWSESLVLQEVTAIYGASRESRDLHLEPSRPYRAYIQWLQQQKITKAEEYWRHVLKGFTAPTPLAIDRQAESVPGRQRNHERGEHEVQLSGIFTSALRQFIRQHQLTLSTLLQGTWALLLSRYSGEEDVVFGATLSGRPVDLTGVEAIVGLFINTLPVRVHTPAEKPVLTWLKELQAQQTELFEYEQTPLIKVQEWSEVQRGTSLFDSILVFENYPTNSSSGRQTSLLRKIRSLYHTNYALTIVVEPGPELSLRIIYDLSRFDQASIARMAGHLQTLLGAMVAMPHECLARLPLLTDAEQQQLLLDWNNTSRPYPNQCIHELFEAQVAQSPDSVALVSDQEQLTYRELNARANQIAHYLRDKGRGAGALVGVCMKRTVNMVAGLLGILKAGAAYVPLDPAYPQERLSFIMQDSEVSVLLTQEQLSANLPSEVPETILMDGDWDAIARHSSENPQREGTTDDLAYVIYTSGSTGKPKGVAIEHHSAAALVQWARECFSSEQLAGVLASTSICFDLSVFELFVPLSCGGTVILSENVLVLPVVPAGATVTLINTVPSAMTELVNRNGIPDSVVTINLAGEPLQRTLVQQIYENTKAKQLFNLYGPTETTTYSTFGLQEREAIEPSIGRPIPNTQIYILDRNLQPVPIGITGELYIGGAGVARGYLNRPEMTTERFIPNPFSNESGARLYKTGDLARYRADGNIEFLGRQDHQVKIRGFRVELGEIEAVLDSHPAVKEVVVVARNDGRGAKHLVAYVVLHPEAAVTQTALRDHARKSLPEYTVPSTFLILDRLPLTPNGKVDRKALPLPAKTLPESEKPFEGPRTPLEEIVARILAEVLEVNHIGVDDNFFDLGGHSLRATQIISRLRNVLQIELPLQVIFDAPTVASLSAAIVKKEIEQRDGETILQLLAGAKEDANRVVPK